MEISQETYHGIQWNSKDHYDNCGMNCSCCRYKHDGPDPCILCKNKEKYDLLKTYLSNMYTNIYNNIKQEIIDKKDLLDLINDPLQMNVDDHYKNRIQLLNIDDNYPIEWKNECGQTIFVQLRKINKNRLLIGCGNNPTSLCYVNHSENTNAHHHDNYITIDAYVNMNPTIVGFFNLYKIPDKLIPHNRLIDIHTENLFIKDYREEYLKLTGKTSVFYRDISDKDYDEQLLDY
jgi:hypothetical protein